MGYHSKLLDASTWPDFVQLVERHNGVWGGCWCMGFHPEMSRTSAEHNRAEKERRVREGRTHAVLVYDDLACVGWCQYGPMEELPGIKYRRAYEEGGDALPDWRITCFFVDRKYRGRGVAATALTRALEEIGRCGGGTVESYPEDFNGREVSKSLPYMYNGPIAMFERQGFERVRRIGKHHWVVTKLVPGGLQGEASDDSSP
jgi:GNAT superfamily N-acetyltransferase